MSARKRSLSPDSSPPRKTRDSSSPPSRSSRDQSPPRRSRDQSPPRRSNRDSSPPRRGGQDRGERENRDRERENRDRGEYQDRDRDSRGGGRGGRGGRGGSGGERGGRDRPPPQQRRRRDSPEPPESMAYGKPESPPEDKPKIQKEKPDFKPSGKLNTAGAESGTGPILKWAEPSDARLPTKKWRLYVFKEDKQLDPYYIHRQSAYLFGRDRQVVDIPLDHPSCSKQHAVLQYRAVEAEDEEGEVTKIVKPYLLDLESTNGSFVNGERLESARYYELREKDVIKFGLSSREFVILHEQSV